MTNFVSIAGWRSITDVRDSIEKALSNKAALQRATTSLVIVRNERISVRKMMSCYWSNSSAFSLDLASAVIRQGSFIGKMQDIDWLHSLEVIYTLNHISIKYQRFFHIMAQYPHQMAVPTLDVDLAWHTHQLSPTKYYAYSTTQTAGILIDHDDKVARDSTVDRLCRNLETLSETLQRTLLPLPLLVLRIRPRGPLNIQHHSPLLPQRRLRRRLRRLRSRA